MLVSAKLFSHPLLVTNRFPQAPALPWTCLLLFIIDQQLATTHDFRSKFSTSSVYFAHCFLLLLPVYDNKKRTMRESSPCRVRSARPHSDNGRGSSSNPLLYWPGNIKADRDKGNKPGPTSAKESWDD